MNSRTVGALVFTFLMVYVFLGSQLVKYISNGKTVILSENWIRVGKKTYDWPQVKMVRLHGKTKFVMGNSKESSVLEFADGKSWLLIDDFYQNYAEMKRFILRMTDESYEEIIAAKKNTEHGFFKIFTGLVVFSAQPVISIAAVIVFVLFGFRFAGNNDFRAVAYVGLLCCVFLVMTAYQLHYFGISESTLMVRNQFMPWKKRYYPLDAISEVAFERQPKTSFGLRIILKNQETNVFYACTLRNATWLEMKAVFEKHEIPVTNECVPS